MLLYDLAPPVAEEDKITNCFVCGEMGVRSNPYGIELSCRNCEGVSWSPYPHPAKVWKETHEFPVPGGGTITDRFTDHSREHVYVA